MPLAAQEPTEKPFGAEVEVSRILTEVRVVDRSGEPVQGLTADDFRVTIDGRPAAVESVLWVPPPDLAEDYAIKVTVRRPATEVFVRQKTVPGRWQ